MVCLCTRKETIPPPALLGNVKCCSKTVDTELTGDGAGPEHLPQTCSSAPQPKDIPFAFRALAVVAGPWPVSGGGLSSLEGGPRSMGPSQEQRLRALEEALGTEGPCV